MKKIILGTLLSVYVLGLFGCATKQPQIATAYSPQTGKFSGVEQSSVAKAYSDRGMVKLIAGGNYAGAIADYTLAIGHKPKDAELYVGRGLAYMKIGDYGAAKMDFDKAAALDPMLGDALKSVDKSSKATSR